MNLKVVAINCLVISLMACTAQGQAAADETQIRALAASWEHAWNQHDMKAMAQLFVEEADFVNVAGRHWKGRREIGARHAERLDQFKESVWTTRDVVVQMLRPDIALVHVKWSIRGDTDPDGKARSPRDGVFTWVVVKDAGLWRIRAAQNTNVGNPPIVSK